MNNEPRPLVIVRRDDDGQPESELATIEHDDTTIVVHLDDGQTIEIDRQELDAALHDEQAA